MHHLEAIAKTQHTMFKELVASQLITEPKIREGKNEADLLSRD
jgi:hypothetical protein